MINRSTYLPPISFMDKLMVRIDPHQSHVNETLLDAQRTCGRWLALRRLRMGLTTQQIAGIALVPKENIVLLESGLGDIYSLSDPARRNLSRNLGRGKDEFEWVERVIAIAQGRAEMLEDSVLASVVAYLDAVDTGELDHVYMEIEAPAQTATTPGVPIETIPLKDELEMVELLRVFADADTYIFAIWEQIHSQMHLGLGEIGTLIDRMLAIGLIEETNKPLLDLKLDSDALQIYRITHLGIQSYNAERIRQAHSLADNPTLTALLPHN